MHLPPRPTKNVSDLSWVSPDCPDVRDGWRTFDTLIRSIVPTAWIVPRPSQTDDPRFVYGFTAGDPLHPEALKITWLIQSVSHVNIFGLTDASLEIFLTDKIITSFVEAPGIYFGQFHRTINLVGKLPREIPCTSKGLGQIRMHVQKLAGALIAGTWPTRL